MKMNRKIEVFCCLVLGVIGMAAGVAAASIRLPDEAQRMDNMYNDAERALRDNRTSQKRSIAQHYSTKLAGMREQYQKAGDLAGFQAVMGEQKRLAEEKGVPAEPPSDASIRTLWSTCQEHMKKADEQYQRESPALALRYHGALEDLERRLTKQGDIAAATAVMQHRQEFIESLPPAAPAAPSGLTFADEVTESVEVATPSVPMRPSISMRPRPSMPAAPPATAKPEAEKDAEGSYIAEKLLAFAGEFIGQSIDVSGKILRIERSGMDRNTLRIELEGGVFANVSLEPFERRAKQMKQRFELSARTMGDVGLYVGNARYLNTGATITLRGVLQLRMNRHLLENAAILKISESSTASLLGIRGYYR